MSDLEALINILPPDISVALYKNEILNDLLEVILDLGRFPEARFPNTDIVLNNREITGEDLDYVVSRLGVLVETIERALKEHSIEFLLCVIVKEKLWESLVESEDMFLVQAE